MDKLSVEAIVRSLHENSVRYLIVGGLAVVAHGHVRFTADLDLIVDLEEGNLRRAMGALARLGYRPRAPVAMEEFADPRKRKQWVEEKQMKVFSLFSPEHPSTEIDIFAQMPFDFNKAYSSCVRFELAPGLDATFIDFERLLDLKSQAGRPQDLQDIERLNSLRGETNGQ